MSRLIPTGKCWCGCGQDVDLGSFFAPGHDKRAEARVVMEEFGGVPQFLAAFGRAPVDAVGVEGTDRARAKLAVLQAIKAKLDHLTAVVERLASEPEDERHE